AHLIIHYHQNYPLVDGDAGALFLDDVAHPQPGIVARHELFFERVSHAAYAHLDPLAHGDERERLTSALELSLPCRHAIDAAVGADHARLDPRVRDGDEILQVGEIMIRPAPARAEEDYLLRPA